MLWMVVGFSTASYVGNIVIEADRKNPSREPPTRPTALIVKDIYRAHLPLILAITVVIVTINFFANRMMASAILPSLVVSTLQALVPFAAHRYVLTGERNAGFKALVGSPLAHALFILLGLIVSWGFASTLPYFMKSLAFISIGLSTTTSTGEILFLALLILLIAIFVVSMFGTMLPALVDRGDISPIVALKRGTTWPIFRRLLLLAVGSAFVAYIYMGFFFPLLVPFLFKLGVNAFIFVGIIESIMELMIFLITITCAVILSKAYLGSYTTAAT